jgi:hypothetical protein
MSGQELEGYEWPDLTTALDIDRHDPTVYRIGRLIIRTLYQSDVGLVGCAGRPRLRAPSSPLRAMPPLPAPGLGAVPAPP